MPSTIQEIYTRHQIPRNLQRHMYRVASVGEYIAENWSSSLDTSSIVSTLLLHDMGNILKFDFSRGMSLFDADEQDLTRWRQVQQKYREQYGDDVHDATLAMANSEGVSDRVLELITKMGSSRLSDALESADWEQKICIYSDFRVDPHGFVSVESRFADILERYAGRHHPLSNEEQTIKNRDACLELEKQLVEHLEKSLTDLPLTDLETRVKYLPEYFLS